MDTLKAIGGGTVGCVGIVAAGGVVVLVAVLGFGYFACSTWNDAKRSMATSREIEKRLAVAVRSLHFTETREAIEGQVIWENLGDVAIAGAAGTIHLNDTGGSYVYTLDVEVAQEIAPRKSVTLSFRAPAFVRPGLDPKTRPDPATLTPVFFGKRLALADGYEFAR